uniref:Uncharacterized protein n=1 Tax=Anguilla anguilla TaxID=7936 RepID=A0A0E9XVW0_ANGAN
MSKLQWCRGMVLVFHYQDQRFKPCFPLFSLRSFCPLCCVSAQKNER